MARGESVSTNHDKLLYKKNFSFRPQLPVWLVAEAQGTGVHAFFPPTVSENQQKMINQAFTIENGCAEDGTGQGFGSPFFQKERRFTKEEINWACVVCVNMHFVRRTLCTLKEGLIDRIPCLFISTSLATCPHS